MSIWTVVREVLRYSVSNNTCLCNVCRLWRAVVYGDAALCATVTVPVPVMLLLMLMDVDLAWVVLCMCCSLSLWVC